MTDLSTPITAMPSLQRRFEGRALRSLVLTTLVWFGALLASVPLISVLYMLITRGGARLSLEVFTELPPTGFETHGGFGFANEYDVERKFRETRLYQMVEMADLHA